MIALKYNINYRNITLTAETVEMVGVYKKGGRIDYIRWLGFVSLNTARWFKNKATPVKLSINSFTRDYTSSHYEWKMLKDNEYIQGCLIHNGVFGVMENGEPRVIVKGEN